MTLSMLMPYGFNRERMCVIWHERLLSAPARLNALRGINPPLASTLTSRNCVGLRIA